jgi:hypothetical protein
MTTTTHSDKHWTDKGGHVTGTWGQVSMETFRWVRGTSDRVVNGAMDGVAVLMTAVTRQERQGSVESVGAGAGSSARS